MLCYFQELNHVVRADVESEFLDSNHTNCLLLRQLFQQAEKWHLKLNVDTLELENKALLDEVAKLEDSTSSMSLRNESKTKLTPLQDSGSFHEILTVTIMGWQALYLHLIIYSVSLPDNFLFNFCHDFKFVGLILFKSNTNFWAIINFCACVKFAGLFKNKFSNLGRLYFIIV